MINENSSAMIQDILSNANIGMWAIEIDDGAEPRMYADETMRRLLGVEGEPTPEQLYHSWYDNIHPDHYDAVADAVGKMIGGARAEVQYPWFLHGAEIFVRCGGVRDKGYTKGVRLEGCHQDVTELFHVQKQVDTLLEERMKDTLASQRTLDILTAIGDAYESIYYVDPSEDSFAVFRRSEYLTGAYKDADVSFSEGFSAYIMRDVHPDDRALMLRLTDAKYLSAELREKPRMHVQYRDIHTGEPQYYEMRLMRSLNFEETGNIILCFMNRHESTEMEMLQRKIMQRNYDIIEILASEYTSVYYIDLTTDELTPYTMNEETEHQFGVLFKDMSYSDAFRMYVDTLIYPEDKAMMLRAGSIGNIMKELRTKKTFITTYRSDNNGDPHYCEMKFVKVGDESGVPRAVALGFADKDEELRQRIEQETVRRRNTEIIEILASEYSSVYYIDLTTGELDPYTMNEETESEFGPIFRSGIKYIDAYRMYVDTIVQPEDKAMMLRAGSIYNILLELRDKKSFITTYRSRGDGEPRYCEMKFVKVGDDESPQAVALGFADRDEEMRKAMAASIEREKNFEIIEILASEYSSVYYIDLNTGALTPYTMNDRTKGFFGDDLSEDMSYLDAFALYVEKGVAPESREAMLRAGSIGNIRRELAQQKTFITTYLNDDGLYSEMKFVKVGDDKSEPQAVALGFSVIDEQYRQELAAKQREAFINSLADDYEAVFHVDANTGFIECIRTTGEYTRRNVPLSDGVLYDEYLSIISGRIPQTERKAFIDATKLSSVSSTFEKYHAFFVNYVIELDGVQTYYQIKFIHTGDWKVDRNFLLGVHNMDKLTREQLAQSEALDRALTEAESANVAKTTFLFNMSHDIRTPMNAIIGFTDMAQKHIDDRARVIDCLEKVRMSSDHLLSLINDVLDMSRIESGKIIIEEHPVDLMDCMSDLEDLVSTLAKEKSVRLTFNTDISEESRLVYADELRLNRVLINILNNAIKYTPSGGYVNCDVKESPSEREGYTRYRFCVSDNGIGMSEEFLSHIFEAFAREQNSTVSGIQGTGLGLTITKELVELMGGSLKIDSKLGSGTTVTFVIDLRLAAEEDVLGAKQPVSCDSLAGMRVLLVEDNDLNREIAKDLLEEMGMIVEEAEDGTVAVQKYAATMQCGAESCYDMVLMDIQMPIMDGYTATGEIRRIPVPGGKHIPIIAMTANAFAEDRQRALDAGMDAHLAKPINVTELVSVLASFAK